jgi:hypothetical protein
VAWPVYSTRFLLATLNAAWTWYAVPAGYVAVIKSLVIVNNSADPGDGLVAINTDLLWIEHFPGAGGAKSTSMHQVVNGGEAIGANPSNGGMHIAVSGFLLRDDGTRAQLLPAPSDELEPPIGPQLRVPRVD